MQFEKMMNEAGIAPIFYRGIRAERDSTVGTGTVSDRGLPLSPAALA